MNGTKNEKFFERVVSMIPIVWIQSAFRAIYGQITKLNTVIGMSIMKYNFSVDVWVLKETWILQHA